MLHTIPALFGACCLFALILFPVVLVFDPQLSLSWRISQTLYSVLMITLKTRAIPIIRSNI